MTLTHSVSAPEARLLFLAAGGAANDDAIARLAGSRLDWDVLVRLAEHERATAVLWRRVRATAPDAIPADVAARLDRLTRVADFRALHLESRLERALALLEAAGVRAVLLKGAALAVTVYGSFRDRPMGDVDVLVEGDRAEHARSILIGGGWSWQHEPELDEFYAGHHHLPPLVDSSGTGLALELHTDLYMPGHPFEVETSVVWREARAVRLGGSGAHVPTPARLLEHTCLHFAWSHLMRSSAWRTFRDLDALVASGQVDWPTFVAATGGGPARTCCYWTLRLAQHLAGVAVPDEVLASLRPPRVEATLRRLERHVSLELLAGEAVCPSLRLTRYLWERAVLPEWSGHGKVRPWHRTDAFVRARSAAARAPRSARRSLSESVGLWATYMRSFATVSPSSSRVG